MSKLQVGDKAPDFKTLASNGQTGLPDGRQVSLKDFKGKNVVLYFYPKDDTPGCTIEACNFRDNLPSFDKINAVVLGVSPDSVKSHDKFIKKFELPFILLSDEDKKICEAYGVWVEKSMYGRKYMGVERSTFIINSDGKLSHIFRKVNPKAHHEEVLEALKST